MIANLSFNQTPSVLYSQGYLPQRNQKGLWYQDTSSRANMSAYNLSSENRRILKNTQDWQYDLIPLADFNLSPQVKKQIIGWTKTLNWSFPPSSLKTVFQNHLFNYVYLWHRPSEPIEAYSLCYLEPSLCHIAYVFYDPSLQKSNLPIRLVLQTVIDSYQAQKKYCYLGGFNPDTRYGYYKRTLPGFEYYQAPHWVKYRHDS